MPDQATPINGTAKRLETWAQVAIVVIMLIGVALDVSARLARIEQWEVSADTDRTRMETSISRIEGRINGLTDRGK